MGCRLAPVILKCYKFKFSRNVALLRIFGLLLTA